MSAGFELLGIALLYKTIQRPRAHRTETVLNEPDFPEYLKHPTDVIIPPSRTDPAHVVPYNGGIPTKP